MRFKISAFLMCIIFLLGCTNKKNGENEKEAFTFKFGHLANEDHVWHQSALKFSEQVQQKSEGRIQVKIYPNEQLGNELDMVTGILAGTVDMTITGESLQNWVSEAALCAIPYMISDTTHLKEVAGGEIGKNIEEKIISEVGLRPVTWFQRGARHLTSNKPIKTPNDLKGMILRVPNVPIFIDTWQALGAKPTPMAFSEVFTALQQGTIQAQENPLSLIRSAGFYEVQDYVNLTEHVIGWVYVVVGEKQFQKLPDDLQKVFIEAAQDMQTYHDEIFSVKQSEFAADLKNKGMQFIEVDKTSFRNTARETVIENLNNDQKKLYSQIVNPR